MVKLLNQCTVIRFIAVHCGIGLFKYLTDLICILMAERERLSRNVLCLPLICYWKVIK